MVGVVISQQDWTTPVVLVFISIFARTAFLAFLTLNPT